MMTTIPRRPRAQSFCIQFFFCRARATHIHIRRHTWRARSQVIHISTCLLYVQRSTSTHIPMSIYIPRLHATSPTQNTCRARARARTRILRVVVLVVSDVCVCLCCWCGRRVYGMGWVDLSPPIHPFPHTHTSIYAFARNMWWLLYYGLVGWCEQEANNTTATTNTTKKKQQSQCCWTHRAVLMPFVGVPGSTMCVRVCLCVQVCAS